MNNKYSSPYKSTTPSDEQHWFEKSDRPYESADKPTFTNELNNASVEQFRIVLARSYDILPEEITYKFAPILTSTGEVSTHVWVEYYMRQICIDSQGNLTGKTKQRLIYRYKAMVPRKLTQDARKKTVDDVDPEADLGINLQHPRIKK